MTWSAMMRASSSRYPRPRSAPSARSRASATLNLIRPGAMAASSSVAAMLQRFLTRQCKHCRWILHTIPFRISADETPDIGVDTELNGDLLQVAGELERHLIILADGRAQSPAKIAYWPEGEQA